MGNMTFEQSEINNRFTYHKPFGNQPERYQGLREKAKELAYLILESCPFSREKDIAIMKLEESIFFANASIARNEFEPSTEDIPTTEDK